MSELYSSAKKAITFEAINTQLIEAEQALQAQNRILDLLAEIDQDLIRKRAELSKAVTDLKWKTIALDKSNKPSVVSLFNGILGRRKEWEAAVQNGYELALSRYETHKNKITLLESEREALDQQLITLADSQERYLAARHQQQAFILASCKGESVDQLLTLSRQLQQTQSRCTLMKTALSAGTDAAKQLQAFIQRLAKPLSWVDGMFLAPTEIWLIPAAVMTEQSVIAKLSASAKDIQETLDDFQEKLAITSWQFWPALSITKPNSRFSTLEQLIRCWLYRSQQNQSRLNAKLDQLNRAVEDSQQTASELEAEQNRLIDVIWRKENFPEGSA